jgi:hypothetical protein
MEQKWRTDRHALPKHSTPIPMKRNLKSAILAAAIIFGTGVSCIMVTGCERKPKTLGEKIDDALDARPHEKIKDAGEDLKEGVKDAVDDAKK